MDAALPRLSTPLRLGLLAGGIAVRAGRWWRRGGAVALALALAVLLAALGGLVERLPDHVRPLAVWAALALALALAVRAVRAPPPGARPVRRWLERAAGLPAGALGALGDPAAAWADPLGQALWSRAREEAAAARPVPRPATAWRALAPVAGAALLGVAAVALAPERLARALSPWPHDLRALRMAVLVDPPGWTGRAPRRHPLAPGQRLDLEAMRGSRLALVVEGAGPDIAVDGAAPRPWTLEAPRTFRVHAGLRTLARVRVAVAPDSPPRIAWLAMPRGAPSGVLAVAWRARDDHPGLVVGLELARGGERRQLWQPGRWPAGDGQRVVDVARDAWAGQMVDLRLLVRDGAGQVARSEAVALRLPERSFADPVAREVIAARARLLDTPAARLDVAQRLLELAGEPARFGERLPVFAGLSAAARRLAASDTAEATQSAADLMWDVAAAIEDGGAGAALDRLAEALSAIEDALSGAGSDADIRRALEELARAADAAAALAGGQPARAATAEELALAQAFAAELADRLAAGDRAGARAMIAALRQSVEAARAQQAGASGLASAAALERAAQARALAQQQRALAGQTQAGAGERLGELAGPQGALAAAARRAGGLEAAARAMGEAQDALRAGDRVRAGAAQRAALDALDQAAQALEAQAAAALPALGRDPLGRPGGGSVAGDIRLGEAERARQLEEIRALLRERAADPARSPAERAYFLRLLRRF